MSENQKISIGDTVRYIKDRNLNGGLVMSIVDTNDGKAKIGFFDSVGTHKEIWVDMVDLQLVHKVDGGFGNPR